MDVRPEFLQIIGLCFNIIGALLLVYDADKMNTIVSKILSDLADWAGRWRDNPIPDEMRNEYQATLKCSTLIVRVAFSLLVVGFLIQLLSYIIF